MHLLYTAYSEWEEDFVQNELLAEVEIESRTFYTHDTLLSLVQRPELVNNNIFVVNNKTDLQKVLQVVSVIRPVVLLLLSDEYGYQTHWVVALAPWTRLLLHQYCHAHYEYPVGRHLHIPLGYVKHFLSGGPSFAKPMADRRFDFAFVGVVKSDRAKMCETFARAFPADRLALMPVPIHPWTLVQLTVSPQQVYEVYNDSRFVLVGRGNRSLDCFRVYEAVVAGAIPVVVGSEAEYTHTFTFAGERMPAVRASSWEEAVTQCQVMLSDPAALQHQQDRLLQWWEDVMGALRTRMNEIL